jgi:hypothetical protein
MAKRVKLQDFPLDKYTKQTPNRVKCPFCGTSRVTEEPYPDRGEGFTYCLIRYCLLDNCGKTWTENYTLSSVEESADA